MLGVLVWAWLSTAIICSSYFLLLPITNMPHLPSKEPDGLFEMQFRLFVFEHFISAWVRGTAVQWELPSSGKGLKPAMYVLAKHE